MLKCFQYALKDRARSWLLSLLPNSINNWSEACEKFILKYYPNHKTQELRVKIIDFTQGADKPFHEAWDRFQELLRQCPQHQLTNVMLMQFFYDGLIQTAQFMVDSTAGGNIARKTAAELNEIFQTLAESSQQKSTCGRRVEASASYNQGQQNFNSRWRGQQPYAPQPNFSQQYPPRYQQQANFQPNQQFQNAPQFQKYIQPQKSSLEDTMQSFMEMTKQNLEMTKQNMESQSATIKRLEMTIAQFMVDSTVGGNIARKTVDELKGIFKTLAESSQQKSVRGKKVEASAVSQTGDLQKQLASLMRELQQLKMSKMETPPVPA
ncbi:uncharacterized protein LOC131023107 [Salvia miltiorrhiza]|uniref:uncharacterized protein LOC131023107 n=1 Tax=Salvia miltiorrhiza TaxID=226208 RepID=UPI0025ACFD78|nr:uncharacterized protein LOC131023107 [Salvia miltiorrhiza]